MVKLQLEAIGDAIQSLSSLIETRFLDVGNGLESAVEILDRLALTSKQLVAELDSEDLRAITRALSAAAAEVTEVLGGRGGQQKALARLVDLSAVIGRHLSLIRQAVASISMLSVNARIAAAGLGNSGSDFASFSEEIGHALMRARGNLDAFGAQLTGLDGHLQTARDSEMIFSQRHTEAIRAVPQRLSTDVDTIAARRQGAATAATAVGSRSDEVRQRIGEAVMALQIGDITRQRTEHAIQAIDAIGQVLAAARADTGDWRDLTDRQRQLLTAVGCELQSAQLADTAHQFDKEVRKVLAALEVLAADARDIVGLASGVYAASSDRSDLFLVELESDVAQARELLEGFATARREADSVIGSVPEAVAKLVRHINMVRSLEADIRIMGLNTSLKCGRLGSRGRALGVIAQELRSYANQTAIEASAIMRGLEDFATVGDSLSAQDQNGQGAGIAAIYQTMTTAIARLAALGESLAAARGTLERDGDKVVRILDETMARIAVHEEIGNGLQQAGAALARLAVEVEVCHRDGNEDVGEATGRLLALIARSYTMAREREIHDRLGRGTAAALPSATNSPPGQTTVPGAGIDDVLF